MIEGKDRRIHRKAKVDDLLTTVRDPGDKPRVLGTPVSTPPPFFSLEVLINNVNSNIDSYNTQTSAIDST